MCGEWAEECVWENETNRNKPSRNDTKPIKSGIKERLSILAVLFTRLLVQRSGWCDFYCSGKSPTNISTTAGSVIHNSIACKSASQ